MYNMYLLVFSPYLYISIIIICHDDEDGKTSFYMYKGLALSLFLLNECLMTVMHTGHTELTSFKKHIYYSRL